MECALCREVVPVGETMTHVCPGTWLPAQEENSEAPALATELNSITNTQASTSSFPLQDTEIESNDSTTEAVDNSPFAGVTGSAPLDSHHPSLTPSTDPVGDERVTTVGDVESDDSSSTIVPRASTPRPRAAQTSRVETSSAPVSAAVASSTASLTEFHTENTRVNGIVRPAVSSSGSSPAGTPTASTSSRLRSNTRSRATTRARSATVSNHAFDLNPAQTEAFPDFVDTPPPPQNNNNTTLVNGVNGIHGVTTTTAADEIEAPLPSAEVLSRRTRREEIHYSDQVRGNILANIFGRSAVDASGRLLPDTEGGPVRSSAYARPDPAPVDDSDSESDSGGFDNSVAQASSSDSQASFAPQVSSFDGQASPSDAQASNASHRQSSSSARASNTFGRAPPAYSQVSPPTNGTLTNGQTPRDGQRFTYRGLTTSNQASTPSGQASTDSQSSTNRQSSTDSQSSTNVQSSADSQSSINRQSSTNRQSSINRQSSTDSQSSTAARPISYRRVTASSYGSGIRPGENRRAQYTEVVYGRPGEASTSRQSPNFPQSFAQAFAQVFNNLESSASGQTSIFDGHFPTDRQAVDFFGHALAPRQTRTTRQTPVISEVISEEDSTSHGQSHNSGQSSSTEQASATEHTSVTGQDSTAGQGSTSVQASTASQTTSTYEQDSSSRNSSSTSTGTSNNNQRNSRNIRSSGPEDCKPYIDGITKHRKDEDEGDDGPSSTSTGAFTAPNNAYKTASMSLNSTSNSSGSNNNTSSGNNTHSANSSQGLFTNFLDNSNNNTANMNMSRQGTPTSSPGSQHPSNQVNGASGVPGMGMGMNMPMNAGHQMDLNHLYEMVLELSDVLKNNRDMTKGIITSAEEIMRRATSEEAGPTLQQVNGEITAGRIAELERALAREKGLNEVLKREQAENTKLIGEYEAAVGTMVEQIRNYCQNNNMHYLAQKRHYNDLLQVERDSHLKSRLERDEWEAKALRCADMIRTAYRLRCEEEEAPTRVVQGLQNEVRAYRNALGMEPEKPEEEYGWEVLKDVPGGPDLGID